MIISSYSTLCAEPGIEYGTDRKVPHQVGEFGGYKHPNALRYETSLCLANGAACSIGDQLHQRIDG